MPRTKKDGAPEPKRRSRTGCWPCKKRKVKCGEEKPRCLNCDRTGEACDYSIRLNWGVRTKSKEDGFQLEPGSGTSSPPTIVFPTPEELTGQASPSSPRSALERASAPGTPVFRHVRSQSSNSHRRTASPTIDPALAPVVFTAHARSISHDYQRTAKITATLPLESGVPMSAGFERSTITSAPRNFSFRAQQTAYPYDSSAWSPDSPMLVREGTPSQVSQTVPQLHSLQASPSPSVKPSSAFAEDQYLTSGHSPKRARLGVCREPSPKAGSSPLSDSRFDLQEAHQGDYLHSQNSFNTMPLTPAPSIGSDDYVKAAKSIAAVPPFTAAPPAQDPPEMRRLSVQSLLADPLEQVKPWRPPSQPKYPKQVALEESMTYGHDVGNPDFDTPRNDDESAILPFSPPARRESVLAYLNANGETEWDGPFNPFSSRSKVIAFEPGGYYATHVPIKIPSSLEPLPQMLLERKMNLLYFHHFLNHTARILVPHDCAENPFRTVLPGMAVKNPDLMNLLLAYSASHRARLLHHPEPANRIAFYVEGVFPKLRHALTTEEAISTSTIATAIMLASLEILSPGAFGVGIPWRHHLSIARQMIVARGGTGSFNRSDSVEYFLIRWFAYLDVIGSLSGGKNELPLSSTYWNDDVDPVSQIDCLLAFTTDCLRTLARLANLVHECQSERIDDTGRINTQWRPPPSIAAEAESLKAQLHTARQMVYKPCLFGSAETETEGSWEALELQAANDQFHWAGIIQLNRRVLNLPTDDPETQLAIKEIVNDLYKIREGSSAEANILFPLFTAGANSNDPVQRKKIKERLEVVENFGMSHMTKAKTLMQRVWDTGRPWEGLVSDEFLG